MGRFYFVDMSLESVLRVFGGMVSEKMLVIRECWKIVM